MTHSPRIDWVDYAKGISIILVVMMHATLSTEAALGASGWLHPVVEFAKPFRIPAFFLIAGLFAARGMTKPWRTFIDSKVLHFAYFYVLWLTIQFLFRGPVYAVEDGALETLGQYLLAFIDPFGTLWFIYLLPVFFVVTRLTRGLPPALVLIAAALLEAAPIATGWTLIDEFAGRFVYFYAGYLFGRWIVTHAEWFRTNPATTTAMLAGWGIITAACVSAGVATWPGVSLALGFLGAAAVIAISVLMARAGMLGGIRYCGQNSIVIYLAFFLPMIATRMALTKTELIVDPGLVAALVTLVAVVTPLILHRIVRGTAFAFLFERPARFRLHTNKKPTLQPAE
ncbi:acyltransferase family protein [Pseudorhodoplanes sp.]|uniref:acyltransferase family protein n=1 Tax=Pseudorhodoplanes sp. TaxID=1934341 RepID=UPI002BA334FE|nr:acyltransferase family protein [Pseudorhodoplanes sp.]HWV41235.1 acyltransferase family protein [Pseudorhodoplanes sp.]